MPYSQLLEPINNFLKVSTPQTWLEQAKAEENLPILLIDHLICELNVNMCKLSLATKKLGGDYIKLTLW
jgi:tRNA-(ms[2]io[6]A)-hydroxylase